MAKKYWAVRYETKPGLVVERMIWAKTKEEVISHLYFYPSFKRAVKVDVWPAAKPEKDVPIGGPIIRFHNSRPESFD